MRLSTVERWISGIGIAAITGGAHWLGALETRVQQLEQRVQELRMGPRGENCQQIVGKLVERPSDEGLLRLAKQWGCSDMPAAHIMSAEERQIAPEVKRCGDRTVVLAEEPCPAEPPPAPPPPQPQPE